MIFSVKCCYCFVLIHQPQQYLIGFIKVLRQHISFIRKKVYMIIQVQTMILVLCHRVLYLKEVLIAYVVINDNSIISHCLRLCVCILITYFPSGLYLLRKSLFFPGFF